MAVIVLIAFAGGMLVTLSRQLNGRLALSTSAVISSLWNHAVGFVILLAYTLVVLGAGGLWPEGASTAPMLAWMGGIFGAVFVAAGSWLIPRLGAALTSVLLIAGQMLSSVALDLLRGASGNGWMQLGGVLMILAGVWISRNKT
ncbi:DMT family transporter [Ketogulonicigenium vulgare]|uniref:Uncharacterized protein n=1 Tax=Ketogulonicigenium vulgare (strain WSH-001) TaxID=759362 RepID=F9YAB1_KETVW|nr:DMT family transporter [Ketogulonicigenium vulgare]ADO42068.1 conserved hypothetical protein [Ketogulonicigenium vulgare Y25]AEM40284.1 hypothetical protein KVU_0445 [Ketogulonicigenium vulgare WSH-001]ALJ80480.1 hypothetical protein KVH_04375 [Ketogulonicigenium vulgare]ANW33309.1 hypothetical protein KvSKV_04350 [Ketogulonicigenium vulgare]AOZ53990.1 hypothetical protein KVC_0973 [Ketogulonicigenium vulgare]